MNKTEILELLVESGAVAVIRLDNPEKLIKTVEAVYEGGVKSIEITMTVPKALELISESVKYFGDKVIVGVGSVLNEEMAQSAIDAGAKYVVSPVLKQEIIKTAHKNDVPVLPGCFTPTEIQTAYEYGADIIKVFPADVLGIPFFKSILAPMPHLKIMPTGGVTLTNASDWLAAGACVVGVGTALLDKKAIAEEDYEKLTANARILMENINNYKKTIK